MPNLLLLLLAVNDERNKMRIRRRHLRDAADPFDVPERQFQLLYRLSKEATWELCEILRPYVPEPRRETAVPLEIKVVATLNFLASGSYQRRIGQDFLTALSQASISGVIHCIVNAIMHIMHQWIKFPQNLEEIMNVKEQFWEHCGFPGVIGAIDGTHVAIWPPQKNREHLYINRKLYHSLNVMLVSDYNGRILCVNAGHGGRTHDSRVWAASTISVHLEQKYRNGRTGTWLLDAQVRARNAIERCIGTLKGRWRCLRKERALHYNPEFAALIVNSACMLHNVAKHYNVPDVEMHLDEIDNEEVVYGEVNELNRGQTGQQVRKNIIRYYFTR